MYLTGSEIYEYYQLSCDVVWDASREPSETRLHQLSSIKIHIFVR